MDVLNECKDDDDDEWGFEGKGWGVWILFLSEFAWNPFPVPDQLVNMKVASDDQDWIDVLDDNWIIIAVLDDNQWRSWLNFCIG